MPHWQLGSLGEAGCLKQRKPSPFQGVVPYLATADVQAGTVAPEEVVTFAERPARAGLVLGTNDVLQAKMRETDKALLVRVEQSGWLASTGFAQFQPQAVGMVPEFLFQYLRSDAFLRRRDLLSVGSTQQAISDKDLRSIQVGVPDSGEQSRIAHLLRALDNQIEALSRMSSKLELIKEGLVDSLIREIPSDAYEPLVDLCVADICYGIVQPGEFVPEGVPVLAIRDLHGDLETGVHRASHSLDQQYRRSRVETGDVLLSIKGTIGRTAVIPGHFAGNISRDIARLRFGSRVKPEFAQYFLASSRGQRDLMLAVVGTTRAEVSIHALKKYRFPAPAMELQVGFVRAVRSVDQSQGSTEAKILKLQTLRIGLVDDVFSGRVRIPEGIGS
jgi:type I restriction enzyme S subunit